MARTKCWGKFGACVRLRGTIERRLSRKCRAQIWLVAPPNDKHQTSFAICHLLFAIGLKGRMISPPQRSRGGIGRRVRLRTVWGNPWRFESSREQAR
jgi:hypothetical protein